MSQYLPGKTFRDVTQGILIHRDAATTAADQDLFSVDIGSVLLVGFWGRVTVEIGGGSQDFELDLDPDDGGSNVALSTLVAADGDNVGTYYTLNATPGGALVANTDIGAMASPPILLDPGDIFLDVTGTEAGEVEWWAVYVPIEPGAVLTAS